MGPKAKKSLLSWEESDDEEGNVNSSLGSSSKRKLIDSMKDVTSLTLVAGAKFKKRVYSTNVRSTRKQPSSQEELDGKDEIRNEVVVKETVGSRHFLKKFVGRKLDIAEPASHTSYNAEMIDELKQENRGDAKSSLVEGAEDVEMTNSVSEGPAVKEPLEYISLNLSDSEDSPTDEKINTYDLEMDEGLGFEDDVLPLDQRSKALQDMKTKADMNRAIEAYSSSDEDENQWANSQIRKTGHNISSQGKIFTLDKLIVRYTNVLSDSRANMEHLESQKQQLLNEKNLILEKQVNLKTFIESSAQNLADYASELEKRRAAANESTTVTPAAHPEA